MTQVVVGLTQAKLDQAQEDQVPAGLLVDPRTDALVLNGRPGHLQFYSLESDKQLFSVRNSAYLELITFNVCRQESYQS